MTQGKAKGKGKQANEVVRGNVSMVNSGIIVVNSGKVVVYNG